MKLPLTSGVTSSTQLCNKARYSKELEVKQGRKSTQEVTVVLKQKVNWLPPQHPSSPCTHLQGHATILLKKLLLQISKSRRQTP